MSHDTLRHFVFFVYVLMFIHLWRRDTGIMLSVQHKSSTHRIIKIDTCIALK